MGDFFNLFWIGSGIKHDLELIHDPVAINVLKIIDNVCGQLYRKIEDLEEEIKELKK